MGDLTQSLLERFEASFDVLEPPANSRPVSLRNDAVDLGSGKTNLLRERDELLQRAVVDVEGEPQEPAVGGSHLGAHHLIMRPAPAVP